MQLITASATHVSVFATAADISDTAWATHVAQPLPLQVISTAGVMRHTGNKSWNYCISQGKWNKNSFNLTTNLASAAQGQCCKYFSSQLWKHFRYIYIVIYIYCIKKYEEDQCRILSNTSANNTIRNAYVVEVLFTSCNSLFSCINIRPAYSFSYECLQQCIAYIYTRRHAHDVCCPCCDQTKCV